MDEVTIPVKKTSRIRKTTAAEKDEVKVFPPEMITLPVTQKTIPDNLIKLFEEIAGKISQSQHEYEKLQKEIITAKEAWSKEQQDYKRAREEKNNQEQLKKNQDEEVYQYELTRKHKIAEDEFSDKKTAWEKYLQDQKQIIEKDRKELADLRILAGNFEKEKQKAVGAAEEVLRKTLTAEFEIEKKLKEQEIKSEKEILNLKLGSFSEDNKRLSQEVEALKRAFDQATAQVKEIALKVIESRGNAVKPQAISEN